MAIRTTYRSGACSSFHLYACSSRLSTSCGGRCDEEGISPLAIAAHHGPVLRPAGVLRVVEADPVRIAYVGRFGQTNSNQDEEAVAHALRVLGHDVECIEESAAASTILAA